MKGGKESWIEGRLGQPKEELHFSDSHQGKQNYQSFQCEGGKSQTVSGRLAVQMGRKKEGLDWQKCSRPSGPGMRKQESGEQ